MTQRRQRRRRDRFPDSNPIRTLLCVFVIWKALLLLVATLSPGLGYDTSTLLLLRGGDGNGQSRPLPAADGERAQEWFSRGTLHGVGKLVRWDAIYFAKIAERGYLFEQEWAFGWGFTRLIALLSAGLARIGIVSQRGAGPRVEANIGTIIAHTAHLFSVIVLYRLTETVFVGEKGRKLAFTASVLHVITPAGIFLSAPYAESLFALLNYVGYLIYTTSLTPNPGGRSWGKDLNLVLSGAVLSLATTVRSNGLLNGILYLYEVIVELYRLPLDGISLANARKVAALGVAGILVGLGTVTPQWIAYLEYCRDEETGRPWCKQTVPSVYTWVQDHYWNVGFMRYWTLSNLPLFLLAGPMILIMWFSAMWALRGPGDRSLTGATKQDTSPASDVARGESFTYDQLRKFAIPQLVLTILALTTYHVQIITRISSGYMVWYWWLAFLVSEEQQVEIFRRKWNLSSIIIRWIVVYAMVQGGLFVSFLPPA